MRCAICFVPPPEDALTQAGAHWLRRDPYSGAKMCLPVDGLVDEDHAFVTALPRRMGFHGAIKPVFELAVGRRIEELETALDQFCRRAAPVMVPRTEITLLDSGFGLGGMGPCADLDAMAADIVIGFDGFRMPVTEEDLVRGAGRLDARQFYNLATWGHPDVLDRFRFRMPLTGPIDPIEREHVSNVLKRHFGTLLEQPLAIGQLALFIEPEPLAPFLVHSVHRLSAGRQRRRA